MCVLMSVHNISGTIIAKTPGDKQAVIHFEDKEVLILKLPSPDLRKELPNEVSFDLCECWILH